MIEVPERLSWWREEPGGAAWLEQLPRLAAECAERWSLSLEDPFRQGNVSLTLPATRSGGTPVVLKLNFPEPESAHEADALAHWGGEGAVRLLGFDRERNALLVERAIPGNSLWEVEDDEEATRIAAEVLRWLWSRPPPAHHPFRLLADEAEGWTAQARLDWDALGRPFEGGLIEAAEAAARELSASQPAVVLCHQDFQGSNVLRAEREPWLAIDPKPLAGEREFALASIVRSFELGETRDDVVHRLDRLSAELGLDRERARGWALGQTLAWADTDYMSHHVQTARWLVEAA
jgi:streptomycin 6-kinase